MSVSYAYSQVPGVDEEGKWDRKLILGREVIGWRRYLSLDGGYTC